MELAGTDVSFALLNGLARTLPIAALSPGGIAVTQTAGEELGVRNGGASDQAITLELRGSMRSLHVTSVLGREAAGALSQARVAVMTLARLQQLSGLQGRITRVLVRTPRGREAQVRAELLRLAGGRVNVASADADIGVLRQALRPSDQASGFFAAISALLGFLFAFNAMLLTVPERRQAIADLRLIGAKRMAIVQIVVFQAVCLGLAAAIVGLLAGYALSLGVFHQSSGYLAEAFTLGSGTVVGVKPLAQSLLGGIAATLLASSVPLLDLRRGRALDAVYYEDGSPGNAMRGATQARLAVASLTLLALATVIFELRASLAFLACGVLALATMLAVPLVFAGVLRAGAAVVKRTGRFATLHVALASLRSATLRSLALAATGAVAIFGGIALGGSRDDLLRGIDSFSHSYAADADLWVANPDDNQATVTFAPARYAESIARVPGVASVSAFQGGFLEYGGRRVWVIARPPGRNSSVLDSQILAGHPATAIRRLGEGGWIAISEQIAEEQHVGLGGALSLPTPAGEVRFRIAATTSNLAWSPGVIFIGSGDYSRYWHATAPTALGVSRAGGANVERVRSKIAALLGPSSGLEVFTARTREARIDKLTSEGLSRLGEISMLLVVAAILAMASALGSSVWQRRPALAALRLSGVRPPRLRRILLIEASLMIGSGCVTGALAGIYGQAIIDGYLKHVTGFPVLRVATSGRPFVVLAVVVAAVLLIVSMPAWSASRVSPTVALDE